MRRVLFQLLLSVRRRRDDRDGIAGGLDGFLHSIGRVVVVFDYNDDGDGALDFQIRRRCSSGGDVLLFLAPLSLMCRRRDDRVRVWGGFGWFRGWYRARHSFLKCYSMARARSSFAGRYLGGLSRELHRLVFVHC